MVGTDWSRQAHSAGEVLGKEKEDSAGIQHGGQEGMGEWISTVMGQKL